MTMQVIVDGRPLSQPRPRVTIRGTFMPKEYCAYRDEIANAVQVVAQELEDRGAPWDAHRGAYAVALRFFMPDRRSTDIDKLGSTILDALTRAGIWADDRLVTSLRATRSLSAHAPRVEIEVSTSRQDAAE